MIRMPLGGTCHWVKFMQKVKIMEIFLSNGHDSNAWLIEKIKSVSLNIPIVSDYVQNSSVIEWQLSFWRNINKEHDVKTIWHYQSI